MAMWTRGCAVLLLAIPLLVNAAVSDVIDLGPYVSIDVRDPNVLAIAFNSIEYLEENMHTSSHFKLLKIAWAKKSLISLFKRRFKVGLIVGLTKCDKTEVDHDEVECCEVMEGDDAIRHCYVRVVRTRKEDKSYQYEILDSFCGKNPSEQ